jgi:hypothetical protein
MNNKKRQPRLVLVVDCGTTTTTASLPAYTGLSHRTETLTQLHSAQHYSLVVGYHHDCCDRVHRPVGAGCNHDGLTVRLRSKELVVVVLQAQSHTQHALLPHSVCVVTSHHHNKAALTK